LAFAFLSRFFDERVLIRSDIDPSDLSGPLVAASSGGNVAGFLHVSVLHV
jgi:hypothetical protein